MRRLRTFAFFFALIFLTLPNLAFAQDELVTVFDGFANSLAAVCRVTDKFDPGSRVPGMDELSSSLTWVCSQRPAIDRAKLMVEKLLTDYNGFFETAFNDLVGMAGQASGIGFGSVGVEDIIAAGVMGLGDSIREGTLAFSPLVNEAVAKSNLKRTKALTASAPADASAYEKSANNLLRRDPVRIASEMQDMQETSSLIKSAAEAQDIANISRESAKGSFARGDEEQLFKRTTSPDPTGIAKGAADKVEDMGKTANSTRATTAALLKMNVEAAKLTVVGFNNIVTSVKELGLQSAHTNQQLAGMIQMIAKENIDKREAWREDYVDESADRLSLIRGTEANLKMASSFFKIESDDE